MKLVHRCIFSIMALFLVGISITVNMLDSSGVATDDEYQSALENCGPGSLGPGGR
jgi:hypothetical protein